MAVALIIIVLIFIICHAFKFVINLVEFLDMYLSMFTLFTPFYEYFMTLFFYRPQGDLLGKLHGYFCLHLSSSRCLKLLCKLHHLLLQRLQIPNNLQKSATQLLQGQLHQDGDRGGARGVGAG